MLLAQIIYSVLGFHFIGFNHSQFFLGLQQRKAWILLERLHLNGKGSIAHHTGHLARQSLGREALVHRWLSGFRL
jgi:hypothetical protein